MALKLLKQAWNPPADPDLSFAGRTIVVTGSNCGIGYEAALKFHRLGCERLILGVRNISAGEEARRRILDTCLAAKGDIEVWPVDMASYPSMQSFASRLSQLPTLDIAVLNAGVLFSSYAASEYGFERTIQINTVSTILLALLILPKLRASKTSSFIPVLEFTSSGNHRTVTWDTALASSSTPLRTLNDRASTQYNTSQYYDSSKLLLMCSLPHLCRLARSDPAQRTNTAPLPDRGQEIDAIITSACPGFTKTGLARDVLRPWMAPLWTVGMFFIGRTAEQGSRSLVSGVTRGRESHGGFWQHDKFQGYAGLYACFERLRHFWLASKERRELRTYGSKFLMRLKERS
ncbi:hypothetical protein ANO11243_025860 [Dothideomycetidae sp. 11243]|nr:hypothetical protein ANO11243_025860 [fungal sp. No.11243]